MGSPPRMRGKLQCNFFVDAHAGITPADAGKTYAEATLPANNEDHPRGCGEN